MQPCLSLLISSYDKMFQVHLAHFLPRPGIRYFSKEEGHEFFRILVQYYQTTFQKDIIIIYTPIFKA